MTDNLKTPPHSVEAEQAVLGGLLLDTNAMEGVGDLVQESDFYIAANRAVFRAMEAVSNQGTPLDVQTVGHELTRRGELDRVGGFTYLGALLENTPSATNIRHYAKIVREHRLERDLIVASGELADLAYSQGPLAERMDRAQALVMGLSETAATSEARRLGALLTGVVDEIEKRLTSEDELPGRPTGLVDLDRKLAGLKPGNLIIIAGRPGSGKSVLGLQIALHNALQGTPAAYFSLEMSESECAERALVAIGRLDAERVRLGRNLTEADWEGIAAALGRLQAAPLYIDDSADATVPRIRAKARRLRRTKNVELIIVDYLQLLSGRGESRREEVDDISRSLKLLAKELGIPIVALAQLNRALEQRSNKRPQLSDLREAGGLEQDADAVLMLFRDELHNPETSDVGMIEINVVKQRNGPTGTVAGTWLGSQFSIGNYEGKFVPEAYREGAKPRRRSLMAEAGL